MNKWIFLKVPTEIVINDGKIYKMYYYPAICTVIFTKVFKVWNIHTH